MQPNLTNDLNHILAHTKTLWEELRGQRIFITGGTGFFGCWLLESFIWANDQLDLKASAVVLTRNPDSFRQKAPHLANHPAIQFHSGDVRSFQFPEGEFSYIIHGATEASAKLNQEAPLLMFDTIIEGTRHTLEFAKFCGSNFARNASKAAWNSKPSNSPELTSLPSLEPYHSCHSIAE